MSGAGHELFTYAGRSWAVEKVLESWRTQEIAACVPVATLCVGLGLWLRVASGWGLKSVSIVYLLDKCVHPLAFGQMTTCVLCCALCLLQPVLLGQDHPLHGTCVDIGPCSWCS